MSDLIDRQAAIDAVRGRFSMPVDNLIIEVIGNLPSAQPDLQDCGKCIFKGFKQFQPEPQWIPCSERLPDEDHWTGNNFQYSADVLMTVYNAGDEETIIDYGHTTDGKWYSDTTDCYVPSEWEVTAWMPLPEPWKGEEHE